MPVTTFSDFALDSLLDRAADGVFVLDSDRRFVLFNEGFRRITGYASEEILGTQCQCHNALDCRDAYGRTLAGSLCPGLNVFRGVTPVGRQRMQIRRKDGSTTWVETVYTPIQNESGSIECVLGIMRDISDTQEREDVLREAVGTLRDAVSRLRADLAERYGFNNIVARSPRMREVFDRIQAAATHDRAVLITGEAGTGKEMAARAIHAVGLQQDGPFMAFNCSARPTHQIASPPFGGPGGPGAAAGTRHARRLPPLHPGGPRAPAGTRPQRRARARRRAAALAAGLGLRTVLRCLAVGLGREPGTH